MRHPPPFRPGLNGAKFDGSRPQPCTRHFGGIASPATSLSRVADSRNVPRLQALTGTAPRYGSPNQTSA
jgi:hypothetical protein